MSVVEPLVSALASLSEGQDEKVPLSMKMKLKKACKACKADRTVIEELNRQQGVHLLIKLLGRSKAEESSQTIELLILLFSQIDGLDALADHLEQAFVDFVEQLYCSSAIVKSRATELLCTLVDYFGDSYELMNQALGKACQKHGGEKFGVIVSPLHNEKQSDRRSSSILLLSLLLDQPLSSEQEKNLCGDLRSLDFEDALTTARGLLATTDLTTMENLDKLEAQFSAATNNDASHRIDSQADHLLRASSSDLMAKVNAIEGMSELAGLKTSEMVVMQAMERHIQQLTAKLETTESRRESDTNSMATTVAALHQAMDEQKKAFDEQLHDLKATRAGSEREIHQLQEQQALLMEEYDDKQRTALQISEIKKHRQLWQFYQCIQLKLNEVLLGYKVLSSGLVAQDDGVGSSASKGIEKVIMIAGEVIPFPGVKTAATIINKGLSMLRAHKTKKKGNRATSLAVSVGAMEEIAEQCARNLALTYRVQVMHLDQTGARVLGECGVRRMLESMRSGSLDSLADDTDSLMVVKQLTDAIVLVDKRQGILSIKHKKIPTLASLKNLKWDESSIFKKPGIKTEDRRYFSDKKLCDVEKYGYRIGTEEEARALGFTVDLARQPSLIKLESDDDDDSDGVHDTASPLRPSFARPSFSFAPGRKLSQFSSPGARTPLPPAYRVQSSPGALSETGRSPPPRYSNKNEIIEQLQSEQIEMKAKQDTMQLTIGAQQKLLSSLQQQMLQMQQQMDRMAALLADG